jgi:hypothetical protein
LSLEGVSPDEMNGSFGPDDRTDPDLARFAEDLRSAFPSTPVPAGAADEHIVAMMAAAELLAEEASSLGEQAIPDRGAAPRRTTPRRNRMRRRLTVRIAAVATGLLLSFGGLALAGAFPGSDDDPADDTPPAVVSDLPQSDDLDADDQGEDADDQGEDAEDADDADDADDQGEDADDEGDDADDEGDDADDQGEDAEDADDDAEDADDEGDDADDQADEEGGDQDAGGDSDS